MYRYLAFPLVEPIQDEEELRGAPSNTILSDEACRRRIERGESLIRRALPALFKGNVVVQNIKMGTLRIESGRNMSRMLTELGFYVINCNRKGRRKRIKS